MFSHLPLTITFKKLLLSLFLRLTGATEEWRIDHRMTRRWTANHNWRRSQLPDQFKGYSCPQHLNLNKIIHRIFLREKEMTARRSSSDLPRKQLSLGRCLHPGIPLAVTCFMFFMFYVKIYIFPLCWSLFVIFTRPQASSMSQDDCTSVYLSAKNMVKCHKA